MKNDEVFSYILKVAAPFSFALFRNARAMLPIFLDTKTRGHASSPKPKFDLPKKVEKITHFDRILDKTLGGADVYELLDSEYTKTNNLRDARVKFEDRINEDLEARLAHARFYGLRQTDHINAWLASQAKIIAHARCYELTGTISIEESNKIYKLFSQSILKFMRHEKGWKSYFQSCTDYEKIRPADANFRKIRAGGKTCMASYGDTSIHQFGEALAPFSNKELPFDQKNKYAEVKQHLTDLAKEEKWKEVIALIKKEGTGPLERGKFALSFNIEEIPLMAFSELEALELNDEIADLILADFFSEWGYQARGGAVASDVGQKNYELFNDRLSRAVPFIARGIKRDTDIPQFATLLQGISPHIWYDGKEELEAKSEELAERKFPENYLLARQKMHYKVYKWGGSHDLAWKTACEISDRFPKRSDLACLPFYARVEQWFYHSNMADEPEKAKAVLEDSDIEAKLQPYLDRVLNGEQSEYARSYSNPFSWYLLKSEFSAACQILKTRPRLESTDGHFAYYYNDDAIKQVMKYFGSFFIAD